MHSKSDNVETIMGIETDDIINELSKSLLKRCEELETRMEGSHFFLKALTYCIIVFIK